MIEVNINNNECTDVQSISLQSSLASTSTPITIQTQLDIIKNQITSLPLVIHDYRKKQMDFEMRNIHIFATALNELRKNVQILSNMRIKQSMQIQKRLNHEINIFSENKSKFTLY